MTFSRTTRPARLLASLLFVTAGRRGRATFNKLGRRAFPTFDGDPSSALSFYSIRRSGRYAVEIRNCGIHSRESEPSGCCLCSRSVSSDRSLARSLRSSIFSPLVFDQAVASDYSLVALDRWHNTVHSLRRVRLCSGDNNYHHRHRILRLTGADVASVSASSGC